MILSEQSLLAQGQTLFPGAMRCRVDLRVPGPGLCASPRAPGRSPACSGAPQRLGCSRLTVQQSPVPGPAFCTASCVWLMGGLPGALHADVHLDAGSGSRNSDRELWGKACVCPLLVSGAPGARGSISVHTWTRKRAWWQSNIRQTSPQGKEEKVGSEGMSGPPRPHRC